MINEDDFLDLTPEDRVNYIRQSDLDVQSQAFMDGNAKPGSQDAVKEMHRVLSGGVDLTGWRDSKIEALREAADTLENWNGEV